MARLFVVTLLQLKLCAEHCSITRADALAWGRALVLAGFVYLCQQPSGYALYNRPIVTKYVTLLDVV